MHRFTLFAGRVQDDQGTKPEKEEGMSERKERQAVEDVDEQRRREQTGQIGAEDPQIPEEEIEEATTKEGTDQDSSPGR